MINRHQTDYFNWKRMCNRHSVLLLLLCCCVSQAFAQHSLQQKPWQRKATGSQSGPSSYRSTTTQSSSIAGHINKSHYLDYDDWATDKKIRLWDVRLNSRRPNKYSWTSRLVIANVAMFAIQTWKPSVTRMGIKLSNRILRGEELYRLISPIFLHGSIYHLFTNMYSLRNVGETTEGQLAICSQLYSLQILHWALLGAYSGHDWLLGQQGRAYSDAVTQTLLINLFLGAVNPMVDNWGHLGGAIGGAAMAYYFGPRLYLAELPEGGRTIVDRPIVRLPRSIEALPERITNTMTRMARRMQIWRFKSDLPAKPWRPKGGGSINYQRRRNAPNKSIKPDL
eukprot:scaffold9191_cov114-Cylindrotheca_fusiformis.AAC.18